MEIQSVQDKEEREYFSLIERVGSWHRYQFQLAIILSVISMLSAMLIFVAPYLFYSASYQCGDTIGESCTNFVCSLPIEQRKPFKSQSPFDSLADDFGVDFYCEYSSTLTLFSTLIFIGSFSGVLLLSTFTERIGRKNSFALSSILTLIGLILTLLGGLMKSVPLVMCSIFLIYCGSENGYQYVYCFASEVVA